MRKFCYRAPTELESRRQNVQKTCARRVRIPTELPLCIPPLVVGFSLLLHFPRFPPLVVGYTIHALPPRVVCKVGAQDGNGNNNNNSNSSNSNAMLAVKVHSILTLALASLAASASAAMALCSWTGSLTSLLQGGEGERRRKRGERDGDVNLLKVTPHPPFSFFSRQ